MVNVVIDIRGSKLNKSLKEKLIRGRLTGFIGRGRREESVARRRNSISRLFDTRKPLIGFERKWKRFLREGIVPFSEDTREDPPFRG